MSKLTVSKAAPTIARVIGTCNTDARIVTFINEATERLLTMDDWVGSYGQFVFCATDCCITLPRQIESIRAFSICDCPGVIHNDWYEFLANGPGKLSCDSCISNRLVQRGDGYVTHTDIIGINKKIKVQSTQAEDADARILLRGYDENNQWIRTQELGEWIDGEYVDIAVGGTLSTNIFTRLVAVIKPVTNSKVLLYTYNTDTTDLASIAEYETDEELPNYRRIMIPGIQASYGSDCEQVHLTVLAKLRFIPVSNDNDFLQLGNINAIKLMVMAIRKEEQNLYDEAIALEAKARLVLENELSNWYGPGPHIEIRTDSNSTWGGGGIDNAL